MIVIDKLDLLTGIIKEPRSGVESQIVRVGNYNQSLQKINELVDYTKVVFWDDLRSPATAINPPGQVSDPDWDNTNGGWLFDAAGTEVLWIIVQMPHGWKEGTAIRPHIHWMPTNTNTGNVLWRMEYKWTNVHGTDAGTFAILNALDAGDGTALKHQIAGFEEIDGTGKTLSSMLSIKLSRIGGDATDTYNADTLFKEFDIHYQADARGSQQEYIK